MSADGNDGVGGGDRAHWTARVANGEVTGGNVGGHHTSGSNNGTIAYSDSRQNGDICGYPHIVADSDGMCRHYAFVALGWEQCMCDSGDTAIGSNKDVISDCDGSFVENRHIEIADEVIAYMDVESEITSEGAMNDKGLPYRSEQATEMPAALIGHRGGKLIDMKACVGTVGQGFSKFGDIAGSCMDPRSGSERIKQTIVHKLSKGLV